MRKFLTGSLLAASLGGGVVLTGTVLAGPAGASPTCAPGGQGAGGITVNPGSSQVPPSSGTLQVCAENSSLPIEGTVTASGSASTASGYAVADGNDTNPGAGSGYVGVQGGASSGGAQVVGCSSGDYDPSTANVIVGTGGVGQAVCGSNLPAAP